jgi:hypothetical protein
MVHKKYLLLAGLCAAIALPAKAQESQTTGSSASYGSRDMTYRGESYDVLDSTLVPGSRMKQHRKFLNHQYNFPAKPRNMWELGVAGGMYNISGDVPSLNLWQRGGFGFSAHVRKALGYLFSVRLDYNYGNGKGLGFLPSSGFGYNSAWNGTRNPNANYGDPTVNRSGQVFYNYKTEAHQLNLDLVASLGNLLFHKARTKIDPYVFVGVAGNAYQTWINALDANNRPYDFTSFINTQSNGDPNYFRHGNRRDIKDGLKDLLDDSYETAAESDQDRAGADSRRRPVIFKSKKLSFATSFGAGVQFRLSKRINLALEDRVTFFPTTDEDLLDGQRWDEGNAGGPVRSPNKDGINYFSLGLNFNVGGGSRNVEPLYWLNPLDYSYGELSTPRHMLLPEPVLADTDGDGVADQLDKCPGTPAGVAVDAHGCPMDTDGDGVPDDRDKQLITPTECQPVDADGVGKCPCNCTGAVAACGNIGAGSISFSSGSRITPAMQSQLATLAAQMQGSPDCRVVIMGNGGESKAAQQRSWDRVNAIIEFMSEKHNIDRNRFIFNYQGSGSPDAVMYRSANEGEEGPSNVPPPHPNLRRD